MNILGISALYHDSAAALLVNGEIIAAAQEERFTRRKHDPSFPENAIEYVLAEACLNVSDLDFVTFYDKPILKFERLLESYIAMAPLGFRSFQMAMPIWIREKLFLKNFLHKKLKKSYKDFEMHKIMFSEHHFSHAASAFYPSPFDEAVVLTLDGVGEWATATVSIGKENKLKIVKELHFPHSLGMLYSAFTYYLGFKVNSGEYKVMGLAPYGEPKYEKLILEKIIDIKADGSFQMEQSYFNYIAGLTMTNENFSNLFGNPVRKPESDELSQFHMDIAASIQSVTEKIILNMTQSLAAEYKIPNLCMAGGVALNCVANGKILKDSTFKNLWVQPASGDAGGALGAAQALWYNELKKPRLSCKTDSMNGAYLGPKFKGDKVKEELLEAGAIFSKLSEPEIISTTAKALVDGKAVGWFQGRMEFGPRALGNRSILSDPRSDTTQKTLNLKVKFRESFRPFAPSILREDLSEWFELSDDSPYMLLVTKVNESKRCKLTKEEEELFGIELLNIKRSKIPAVTHVDYSARVHTVDKNTNPKYHALLAEFKRLTACPILVNTSFNVRGEPIVGTPLDAFKCFMGTGLEILVIENYMLIKSEQNSNLIENYADKYELD